MAFFILALTQVVQSFNMRSKYSLFKIGIFGNHKLNGAAIISIALIALVLFSPISTAFGLIFLPPSAYLIALGLSFVPLPIMEISKVFS